MRALLPWLFLCLGGILPASAGSLTPVDRTGEVPELPGFILGVQNGPSATTWLPELGAGWVRTSLSWNRIDPIITDISLSLEEVLNSPEMVDDYIHNHDWTSLDNEYRSYLLAGLTPFPVVGLGWYTSYPLYQGEPATPDAIGKDTYLAYMYLHVRALVERWDGDGYEDAEGITLHLWQTENELNQAFLTALWGWRYPAYAEAFGSAWYDWDFLTDLLITLDRAVHDADPSALTTLNFHTDIPPEVNHLFRLPSWEESVTEWRDHMDLVGFDSYPNYYYADPVKGEVIGDRVETLTVLGGFKPVIAMEVGYPSGPSDLGYTPEKQAEFLDEAFHSAVEAGIVGYFHFKLSSPDSDDVDITEQDKMTLAAIGHLFENGHVLACTAWGITHIPYIEEHFLDVLQAVEGYWGLVNDAGERKPAFYVYQQFASEVSPRSSRQVRQPLR